MSIFKKVMQGAAGTTLGNESAGASASVADGVLHASHAALVDQVAIAQGETEGQELQVELNELDVAASRIDTALAQIEASSIGGGASAALSSESLSLLSATLLNEAGVKASGLESASTLGPVEATHEVVLGLESVGAELWKSTKETFFKFLDWIAGQFNKLFGGFESLKKKAEKVKDKEDKFTDTLSKDKIKVAISALVKGTDGTTIETNLQAGIKTLAKLAIEDMDAIETAAEATVDAVATALDGKADTFAGTAPSAITAPTTKFEVLFDKVKALGSNEAILGNRNIVGLDDADKTLAKSSALKLDLKSPTKALESKEVAPMDRTAIAALCDEVAGTCERFIDARKKLKDTAAFKSKFGKIVAAAEKLTADADYKEGKATIRTLSKVAQSTGMIANGSLRIKLTAHTKRVMDTAISYADASIKKA